MECDHGGEVAVTVTITTQLITVTSSQFSFAIELRPSIPDMSESGTTIQSNNFPGIGHMLGIQIG